MDPRSAEFDTGRRQSGVVVRESDRDGSCKPESSRFTFRLLGPLGQTLRQETWSEKQLFEAYDLDVKGRPLHLSENDPAINR